MAHLPAWLQGLVGPVQVAIGAAVGRTAVDVAGIVTLVAGGARYVLGRE